MTLNIRILNTPHQQQKQFCKISVSATNQNIDFLYVQENN